MTTKLERRLMPDHLTNSTPTTDTEREEVKDMAIFEPRPARGRRAWDELRTIDPAIDRAVLLESVRQRRRLREQQHRIHNELFGIRAYR